MTIPLSRRCVLVVLCFFGFLITAVAQEAKPLARIALLSDPHVNRASEGMNATFKAHFEKTIAAVNDAKVDFALITGDLTQDGKSEEMSDFKDHLRMLK